MYKLGFGENFLTKTGSLESIKDKISIFGYIKFKNLYNKI